MLQEIWIWNGEYIEYEYVQYLYLEKERKKEKKFVGGCEWNQPSCTVLGDVWQCGSLLTVVTWLLHLRHRRHRSFPLQSHSYSRGCLKPLPSRFSLSVQFLEPSFNSWQLRRRQRRVEFKEEEEEEAIVFGTRRSTMRLLVWCCKSYTMRQRPSLLPLSSLYSIR